MSVIEILHKDHLQVNRLFHLLENARSQDEKMKVLGKIIRKLDDHIFSEKAAFGRILGYHPDLKTQGEKIQEFASEFEAVRKLPEQSREGQAAERDPQLQTALQAKIDELKEVVERHVDETENDIFPEIRKKVESSRLNEIGQAIESNVRLAKDKDFRAA